MEFCSLICPIQTPFAPLRGHARTACGAQWVMGKRMRKEGCLVLPPICKVAVYISRTVPRPSGPRLLPSFLPFLPEERCPDPRALNPILLGTSATSFLHYSIPCHLTAPRRLPPHTKEVCLGPLWPKSLSPLPDLPLSPSPWHPNL